MQGQPHSRLLPGPSPPPVHTRVPPHPAHAHTHTHSHPHTLPPPSRAGRGLRATEGRSHREAVYWGGSAKGRCTGGGRDSGCRALPGPRRPGGGVHLQNNGVVSPSAPLRRGPGAGRDLAGTSREAERPAWAPVPGFPACRPPQSQQPRAFPGSRATRVAACPPGPGGQGWGPEGSQPVLAALPPGRLGQAPPVTEQRAGPVTSGAVWTLPAPVPSPRGLTAPAPALLPRSAHLCSPHRPAWA